MATIYAPHAIDTRTEHYAAVRAEAEARPEAPAIRAIWVPAYGVWVAIEGSHRLAACDELGYVPQIVDVTDETVEHDWQDCASPADLSDPECELVATLLDARRLAEAPAYRYDDQDVPRGRA